MTSLDTRIRPKIVAILNKYGKNVDFTVPSAKVHDPSTGIVTVTPGQTYSVKASPPDKYESRYVDHNLIKADDARIIIAAQGLTFTPVLSMRVTIDSAIWSIVNVMPIYSGELLAAYELRLRR